LHPSSFSFHSPPIKRAQVSIVSPSIKVEVHIAIMSTTRDHILRVPTFLLGLRVVQLVTAVAILGLAAFGVTYFAFDGDSLTLFSVSALLNLCFTPD